MPISCRRAAATMAANDLRRGAIISQERGSKLLEVLEAFHSAGQARQGGFVTLECKDVRTGAKSKMKLAPSKSVEVCNSPHENTSTVWNMRNS